jgi:hypothetical protein
LVGGKRRDLNLFHAKKKNMIEGRLGDRQEVSGVSRPGDGVKNAEQDLTTP